MLTARAGVQLNLPGSTSECRGERDELAMERGVHPGISSVSILGISAEEISSFVIAESSNWRCWVRRVGPAGSVHIYLVCCPCLTVTVSSGSLAAAEGLTNERCYVSEATSRQGRAPSESVSAITFSGDGSPGRLALISARGPVFQLGSKDCQPSFPAFLSSSPVFRL